jgi:hypothetical protein
MEHFINPYDNSYDNLDSTAFTDTTDTRHHRHLQQMALPRTKNDCFVQCKEKSRCFVVFIKEHFYIYLILGLMVGILSSNIYNSYVFGSILQSVDKKSKLDLFFYSLQNDYDFIVQFLQTNNVTFRTIVHKINNSLGLFTNMSHNSYLACTSDLLIPTIDHEKCYQT